LQQAYEGTMLSIQVAQQVLQSDARCMPL
jgi:hypothetical protein